MTLPKCFACCAELNFVPFEISLILYAKRLELFTQLFAGLKEETKKYLVSSDVMISLSCKFMRQFNANAFFLNRILIIQLKRV